MTTNNSQQNQQPENDHIKVYNLIILDESGSMGSIKKETISTFNEIVDTIMEAETKNPEQTHFVSYVSFNTNGIKTRMDRKPAREIEKIDNKSFMPAAMTPLYDAMGTSLLHLENTLKHEQDTEVLVSIITDGLENASHEFNRHSIFELVERLRKKGWTITYYGANQDAEMEAMSLNIINSRNFDATAQGMNEMAVKEKIRRMRYFEKLKDKSMRGKEKTDYFDDDDTLGSPDQK
ncbi:MAG: VWA domain-containing protein [Bacteroidia bacterium]|nr:VWA domain-containing protein [Bacteroidia bacterium]